MREAVQDTTPEFVIDQKTRPCISQRILVGVRQKITKLLMKPSNTLKLDSITLDQFAELQKIFTQFGPIAIMDSSRINEG